MLRISSLSSTVCTLAIVVSASCSSQDASTPGLAPASTEVDSGAPVTPAGDANDATKPRTTPPPLPIIPNAGGPLVARPEIVTLTWQGDSIASDLETFDDWLVPSDFWKDLMAEWGVGPGVHVASYRIPDTAPSTLDDSAIAKLIADLVAAGRIPAPNGSRIYTVYPPTGVIVTNRFLGSGCDGGFQAYHSAFRTASDVLAPYAVTPRCENNAKAAGMSPTDYVTWGASHEVMEAASDPDPLHHPAWVIRTQTDETPEPGENADLCTGHPTRVDGRLVTRNWSNVAAKKGERPCVPAPAGPMFGAFADPMIVAPDTSVTTKVKVYASSDLPDFKVAARPYDPNLSATLNRSVANDGDELELTVTANSRYTATPGSNIVALYAGTSDYTTRHAVIIRRR